jgi:hypothetical protein
MVCAAFEFDDDKVLWMSDVNKIPDLTWQMLRRPHATSVLRNKVKTEDLIGHTDSDYDPEDFQVTTRVVQLRAAPAANHSTLSVAEDATTSYKILVLDGCNQIGTATHFGIAEWAQTAMELSARHTILVSMEHYTSWGELQALCEEFDGSRPSDRHSEFINKAKSLMEKAQPGLFDRVREQKPWIRPAFDGMRWRIEDEEVYQY